MTADDPSHLEALFRYSILGPLLARDLRTHELKRLLKQLAEQEWTDSAGLPHRFSWRTLEAWYYRYQKHGFDGLFARPRVNCARVRAVSGELRELIVAMKQEDPGRSASASGATRSPSSSRRFRRAGGGHGPAARTRRGGRGRVGWLP